MGAPQNRYKNLLDEMENQYTLGSNNHLSTRVIIYNMLINYKINQPVSNPGTGTTPEVSFTHIDGDEDKESLMDPRADKSGVQLKQNAFLVIITV